MNGMGIIGTAFLFLVMVLLSVVPVLLLVAVYFYECWYAVKNSPTLRTRRFAISVALDLCVLFWLIYFAKVLLNPFFYRDLWGGATHFFSFLPTSARLFCFNHMPLLLVFSAFIVYVVLR